MGRLPRLLGVKITNTIGWEQYGQRPQSSSRECVGTNRGQPRYHPQCFTGLKTQTNELTGLKVTNTIGWEEYVRRPQSSSRGRGYLVLLWAQTTNELTTRGGDQGYGRGESRDTTSFSFYNSFLFFRNFFSSPTARRCLCVCQGVCVCVCVCECVCVSACLFEL